MNCQMMLFDSGDGAVSEAIITVRSMTDPPEGYDMEAAMAADQLRSDAEARAQRATLARWARKEYWCA